MTVRVAINGFGRIGRLVLRALLERRCRDSQVVALNSLCPTKSNLHLLMYDSVHGRLPFSASLHEEGGLFFLESLSQKIQILCEKDPRRLPWDALKVDVVLECSGRFTDREGACQHLTAGAKKVLISAPADDADFTVVYGVNHGELRGDHLIVSNASCTTNCLAPLIHVLYQKVGIVHGFVTTIHAYTGDQNLIDANHRDLQRGRAAALSMVPSTTGAARAVERVFPALQGKLDGAAIRVPVSNVSLVDFTFVAPRVTFVDEINEEMRQAATGALKGILAVNDAPLVSVDFNHESASSIFDLNQTHVVNETCCRVLAWYDNEWGFSNRMVDVASLMGRI